MQQRSCEVCKATFSAQRVTKRYCSTKCRTRASRAGTSAPRPVAVADSTAASAVEQPKATSLVPDDGTVVWFTTRELEEAGRLDTALGRTAIVLARRLDEGYRESGAGLSSLAARHEKQLAAATAGAGKEASPLDRRRDDLASRRAARGA